MKRFVYMFLILMAATSCLSREFTEQDSYISFDTRKITVPSDVDEGSVCDTLFITSNRTWGAVFAEEVDWVKIKVNGNENLAGVSKISALPLEFEDNESDQERSVELLVSHESKVEKITVVQEAKSRRLAITSVPAGIESISADGDTFDISFRCNTEWKARVDYTDGMLVTLSAEEGNRSSTISVTVKGNDDPDKEKKGVITLSAEDCPEIDIVLTQKKWTPYFILEDKSEVNVQDGANGYAIAFKTNLNWSAEIISVENYDAAKVSLSETFGDKSANNVKVDFLGCTAFGQKGKIVVRITPEGLPAETLTLYQNPAIRVSFQTPSTANNWPFVTPLFSEFTKSSATATYVGERTEFVLPHGYSLFMYSVKGFWLNTVTGFLGGGNEGDYIELPIVEGRRPVRFEYKFLGTTPIRCCVRTAEGRELEGTTFNTGAQGSVTAVDLNGTVETEVYRIVTLNTQYFQLDDLVIYYE